MDIRQLRYFVAAVEHKSIVKAAQALYLTQPTVSRTLQELEDELGKKLLVRGARRLSLTADGELLYQRALLILDMVSNTVKKLKEDAEDLKGEIKIAMGETPLASFVCDVFAKFHQAHPQVTLDLVAGNEETVTFMLDKSGCDFGLFVGSKARFDYNSITLPGSDAWGIYVKADHPLAGYTEVKAEDLKPYELLISRQVFKNDELSGFFGALNAYRIAATYELPYNAALLCKAGAGVLLSIKDVIPQFADFTFVPLYPRVLVQSFFVWKKGTILSPCSLAFLEEVKRAL